jgi:hypothetical protein
MSGIDSVTESNCQARTLVGRHRAWTRGVLWTAWLMVPLGLCSCGAPLATLFLFGPETADSLWGFSNEGLAGMVAIGVGLVSFLVGTPVGIVWLWRLSGYARTERLITTAQELGLRFAFPSRERTWEGLVESSPHWPQTRKRLAVSVAGLFVGQYQGVRLAMLEPSELYDMPFVPFMPFIEPTYSPVRYSRTHMRIFVVLPDTQAGSKTTLALPASLEQSAQEQGFAVEATEGAIVVVAMKGDLANLDQARQVLDWSVRFWKHLRPGSEEQR